MKYQAVFCPRKAKHNTICHLLIFVISDLWVNKSENATNVGRSDRDMLMIYI